MQVPAILSTLQTTNSRAKCKDLLPQEFSRISLEEAAIMIVLEPRTRLRHNHRLSKRLEEEFQVILSEVDFRD